MRHFAMLNPFTAVRLLLKGEAVLVRTERWQAVERLERYARHRDDCDKRRAYQGACTCGLEGVLLEVYYPITAAYLGHTAAESKRGEG